MTIINDENIKQLVTLYLNSKEKLPSDLANIPIGEWDVSRVTKFNQLFKDARNFNEPLNWDTRHATTMESMFESCVKFNQPLNWNVENVKCTRKMFASCKAFNQPLKWNTGKVMDMSEMFFGCTLFNQPLKWDVSKVEKMESMFTQCESFNQPLTWDVSKVKNMKFMFDYCKEFNQPLNGVDTLYWNMKEVTDMACMFQHCIKFNQPFDIDIPKVNNLTGVFRGCKKFNQPVKWNTPRLEYTSGMFANCSSLNKPVNLDMNRVVSVLGIFFGCEHFNQQVNWDMPYLNNTHSAFFGCKNFNQPVNWDMKEVLHMGGMFDGCETFNQPLNWDVSNVRNMTRMFAECIHFNSELRGKTHPDWNTSKVMDMSEMFTDCRMFNQPLNWDVSKVENMGYMFKGCAHFNQPLNWDVNTVENFECMFLRAESFSQDLTRWVLKEDAELTDMFTGSGMRPELRPTADYPEPTVMLETEVKVNPYQVHKFSDKVDIQKLNQFFQSKTSFNPEKIKNIPENIKVSMNTLIDDIDAYRVENEKGIKKEIVTLTEDIEEGSKINAKIAELNIPEDVMKKWEELFKKRLSLLHRVHTSKPLSRLDIYIKRINTLLTKPSNRTEVLQEKEVLEAIQHVEKEMKDFRINKHDKEVLNKLLLRRLQMVELVGRKNFLEHELKVGASMAAKHRKDLEKLMTNVLNRLEYPIFSKDWVLSIGYSLDYVKRQPILFKKTYLESFLKDCLHAYEGAGGISCAGGVLERFVISLMAGCGAGLSVSENPEYEYLKSIVENGVKKLIPEYILKWYKLHSHAPHKFTTETEEERLDNLRMYLRGFFPENNELIEQLIPEYAISVDNDDFEYKKENSGKRILMNNVYESPATPQITHVPVNKKKPAPKSRTKKKGPNVTKNNVLTSNGLKNIKTKPKTKTKPRPKPRTKKNVLGTAFG